MSMRTKLARVLAVCSISAATMGIASTAHAGYPFPYVCSHTTNSEFSFGAGSDFQADDAYCIGSTYELVMQDNGDFVEYNRYGSLIWDSRTGIWPGAHAVFQSDGNLVVYDFWGTARWSSNTWGHNWSTFWLQQDGNLVIYQNYHSTAIWASGTYGR